MYSEQKNFYTALFRRGWLQEADEQQNMALPIQSSFAKCKTLE